MVETSTGTRTGEGQGMRFKLLVSVALGMLLTIATVHFGSTAGASPSPIRINAGGPQYKDRAGTVWSADAGFTGGQTGSTSHKIAGTRDDALYQTERKGMSGYHFAAPEPG